MWSAQGSGSARWWLLLAALGLLVPVLTPPASGQQADRVGPDPDPVLGAIELSRAAHADGAASHAVIGRVDVFADNLAATALVGPFGTLLLTTGGADASLRPEVLTELERAVGAADGCDPSDPPTVYVIGGTDAVSQRAEDELAATGHCVTRVAGADRIATAIAVAEAVGGPSDTVLLARADDWADAAAVGAWAAETNSRLVVTPSDALDARVADALQRWSPAEIIVVGGTAALSEEVAAAAAEHAPLRRVAGPTRDMTATAIADELWRGDASRDPLVGHGYAGTAWAYLFAAAPLATRANQPILYAGDDGPTGATTAWLADSGGTATPVGPADPPEEPPEPPPPSAGPDLDAVDVGLQTVATLDSPMMLRARPGTAELWIALRSGIVVALHADGTRQVLDIADSVSTGSERGLLGMAFSADGQTLYLSSTNPAGDSVIDAFTIDGDAVDAGSRQQLIEVDQPAGNHNGGDLWTGPDEHLWWALGDGGGANDEFGHGQRADTLLGALVRIDPDGGDPYAVPDDNPFVGGGGAPEVWAYGLRNPFRIAFDPANGDLYIADVGQSSVEEIDYLPAGTGAGSNFGWSVFEGDQPFRPGQLADHVEPVWVQRHRDGNRSIIGGVVYRGAAIPELEGAYLYTDLRNDQIRAILVEDGRVTQHAELGVSLDVPVGFGVDHDGEVYVISLGGAISKIVPA